MGQIFGGVYMLVFNLFKYFSESLENIIENYFNNIAKPSEYIALEEIKSDIKEQERLNESLKMEISELASLETIQGVVDEKGLSYQSNNIKVVVTNE